MSIASRVACVAAGAALGAAIGALGKNGCVHAGAVKVTAAGMRANDAARAVMQSIADEAEDINAEARREAKIDAAVRERLAELEDSIRREVEAKVDAEGQG